MDRDLLLEHTGFLRALARGLLEDESRVDDVLQQTWLAAIQNPPREVRPLRTWLATVALNFARKARREEARRAMREQAVARSEAVPAAIGMAEREAAVRRVVDAVFGLAEPYRTAVILHYYDDLSAREIAERLGVPLETVRTRIKRALQQLRRRLDDEHDGDRRAWGVLLVPLLSPSRASRASAGAGRLRSRLTLTPAAAIVAVVLLGGGSLLLFTQLGSDDAARGRADEHVASSTSSSTSTPNAETPPPESTSSEPTASESDAVASTRSRASADTTPRGSVLVRIVSKLDEKPIEGIRLRVVPKAEAPATPLGHLLDRVTNEKGEALVQHLPVGEATVLLDRTVLDSPVKIEERRETELVLRADTGITIEGHVVDDAGQPVPHADVVFCRPQPGDSGAVIARSDEEGVFRARFIAEPGLYGARASGYAPSLFHALSNLSVGVVKARLVLRGRGGALAGCIVDANGAPVEGADVLFGSVFTDELRGDDEGRLFTVDRARRARTAADGKVDLQGLPTGSARLFVRAAGFAPWVESVAIAPSATSSVTVRLSTGAVVEGTVRDASGQPVEGAAVQLESDDFVDAGISLATSTSIEGAFRLEHVFAGSIRASIDGKKERGIATTTLVSRSGETVRWDAMLSRGRVIAGRVVDDGGRPVEGAAIALTAPTSDPKAWSSRPGFSRNTARSGPDGHFSFANCRDGSHRLDVFEPQQWSRVPFVRLDGVKPGGDEIVVRLGASVRPSAFVTGSLLEPGGEPAAEAIFLVSQEPRSSTSPDAARSDSEGRFRLGPLAPGRYDVNVRAGSYAVALLDDVALAAGQTLDLGAVRLPAPGSLVATLRRDDGKPIGSPGLLVFDAHRTALWDVRLHENVFRAPSLPPGSYMLSVEQELDANVACEEFPFEIRSGQEITLDVPLRAGVQVAVRVIEPEGEEWASTVRVVVRNASRSVAWYRTLGRNRNGRIGMVIALDPGAYTIEALADTGASTSLTSTVLPEPREGQRIEIRLEGPAGPR